MPFFRPGRLLWTASGSPRTRFASFIGMTLVLASATTGTTQPVSSHFEKMDTDPARHSGAHEIGDDGLPMRIVTARPYNPAISFHAAETASAASDGEDARVARRVVIAPSQPPVRQVPNLKPPARSIAHPQAVTKTLPTSRAVGTPLTRVPTTAAKGAAAALRFAYAQLGKPYIWGGAGPYGYDCSGLVLAAWRAAGVRLPHSATAQLHAATAITRSQLRPGDLVFYYGSWSFVDHVAIYVGDGRVLQAPHPGSFVRIVPMDSMPVVGFGRL